MLAVIGDAKICPAALAVLEGCIVQLKTDRLPFSILDIPDRLGLFPNGLCSCVVFESPFPRVIVQISPLTLAGFRPPFMN